MAKSVVLSVSQLNRYVKSLLEQDHKLKDVFVRGEISNFKGQYASGHWYFTLKDKDAAIKAVMFRGFSSQVRFTPENGMTVLVRGEAAVYERDGACQIYCREMQPDGIGDLSFAFEQRKRKLEAEGLFDPAFKKPIPRFPRAIGIITARTGAALQDMLQVLQRRYPAAAVFVRNSLVQGDKAAAELCKALRQMDELGFCDVLIIGRGGGSLEDLWCFNDEELARAIFRCETPVISAVGHEVDFTICDFAADLRAPTPSAAAELATPDTQQLLALLRSHQRLLAGKAQHRIEGMETRFGQLRPLRNRIRSRLAALETKIEGYRTHQALRSPYYSTERAQEKLAGMAQSLNGKMQLCLQRQSARLARDAGMLDALSPFKVMARGYSLITKEGKVIGSAAGLDPGDQVCLQLRDGKLPARILSEEEDAK